MLAATPGLAQERRTFDIPAESAADAIRALARQSGLQVLAPAEDVRGVRTNALQGQYDPMDAVHRLVDGTGLEVVQTGPNTVTIRRPNTAGAQTAVRASSEGDTTAVEEVTVTGSRIKRAGFDTLEAAFTTDAKDIQARGYDNLIQVLDDTPGFVSSGVNPIGTNQTTFNAGQSFADFFGLGSNRTLALVNGQRFVTSNTAAAGNGASTGAGQQVDLNVIPVGLVDHVESVAIGGAPVYGSDAIAGTVNIILKDHFNGLQATAQYGVTDRGDGKSNTFRVLAGGDFAEGRGNAVLSAEYNEQDGLLMSSRTTAYVAFKNPFGGQYARIVGRDVTLAAAPEGGLPFTFFAPGYPYPDPNGDYIRDAAGTPLQFGKDGFEPFHVGADLLGLGSIPGENDGGDGAKFADHFGLLAPTQRTLLNGIAHYDITPHVRANIELDYAHSQGDEISEVALFNSPLFGMAPIAVHLDNPFLTPDERTTLAANGVTDTFFMTRNFSDLLDSRGFLERSNTDLYRVVGGFQGDFTAGGQNMNWNVSFNYGRSRNVTDTQYINGDRLIEATDAVAGPGGTTVCRSGNDACVPINLFGENNFSAAARDYVMDPAMAVNLNTEKVATANLTGNLPFGIAAPIAFNVGAEYRQEHAEFDPDATLRAGSSLWGFSFANPYAPVSGTFDTKEIYGEAVVPLVTPEKPLAFINSLSLEGATRYVDNSINGGALTWSAGGRMSPNLGGWSDGLVLRGVYMHAIRAPAVTELFSGSASTRGGVDDPCDATSYQSGPDPATRTANCTAALAAAGYSSPADFHSTTGNVSPVGFSSGNPNLENETSNSWSLGFVYQPTWLSRFRLSADWSHIRIHNAIALLDISQAMAACYDNPNYPNTPECDSFQRRATAGGGRVAGDLADDYVTGYLNTAQYTFAGLIANAEYSFDLGSLNQSWQDAGSVRLSAKLFYQDKLETVAFGGQTPVDVVGQVGAPRFSAQFNVGYNWNKLDLLAQALWTPSVKNDINDGPNFLPPEFNNVPAYVKFNGTVGYQVLPNVRAQVAVNNIFDKELTESQLLSHAYGTYDLIGRSYVFTVTSTF